MPDTLSAILSSAPTHLALTVTVADLERLQDACRDARDAYLADPTPAALDAVNRARGVYTAAADYRNAVLTARDAVAYLRDIAAYAP